MCRFRNSPRGLSQSLIAFFIFGVVLALWSLQAASYCLHSRPSHAFASFLLLAPALPRPSFCTLHWVSFLISFSDLSNSPPNRPRLRLAVLCGGGPKTPTRNWEVSLEGPHHWSPISIESTVFVLFAWSPGSQEPTLVLVCFSIAVGAWACLSVHESVLAPLTFCGLPGAKLHPSISSPVLWHIAASDRGVSDQVALLFVPLWPFFRTSSSPRVGNSSFSALSSASCWFHQAFPDLGKRGPEGVWPSSSFSCCHP